MFRQFYNLMLKQILSQDTESDGFVSIPQGGVPVIKATTCSYDSYAHVIVNFLRCKCPQVQIFIPRTLEDQISKRELEELESALKALQLENEEFTVENNFPVLVVKNTFKK